MPGQRENENGLRWSSGKLQGTVESGILAVRVHGTLHIALNIQIAAVV